MIKKEFDVPPRGAIPILKALQLYLPSYYWESVVKARSSCLIAPRDPLSSGNYKYTDRVKMDHTLRLERWASEDAEHAAWSEMVGQLRERLESGALVAIGQEDPPFSKWRVISTPAWPQMSLTNVQIGEASVGDKVIYNIYILKPTDNSPKDARLPGRPSKGKQIIIAEFLRRKSDGRAFPSRSEEAAELASWYNLKYPDEEPAVAKTIYNHYLGEFYTGSSEGRGAYPK